MQMAKIIDIMTRKKWARPKPRQVAAKVGRRQQKPFAGWEDWQTIGEIAGPIVARLSTR
jgi:hypothetical protein